MFGWARTSSAQPRSASSLVASRGCARPSLSDSTLKYGASAPRTRGADDACRCARRRQLRRRVEIG
eukprot:scaffold6247_cov416-Prasinococcus_capsulatus_cf.AAC.1